ncbi:MAG: di-trans,poly-cis-decaprenylcistransferase [Alphaproteobacteria bacterium CG11_big_fil_rev_8_21_14_0_20_44_7]|nr:MAG: di-trans,poly-cis-decaprenylcistransferase [Alphaproteobacteria bacterium CG11_big_fil_rev_8_21_14_0_20_44_7]
MPKIPSSVIPKHIAIIMDGNGRWAKSRGLPRSAGHKKGAESLKKIVAESIRQGVGYLTVYAFSSENWQRPKAEIGFLMDLLKSQIKAQLGELAKNGVRIKAIGDLQMLADDVKAAILDAEEVTKHNDKLHLQVALSYGGRQEILHAARKTAGESADFEAALYTSGVPDPDLLIRTGGEMRISNFLLWQIAYTELYFTEKLWPEFKEEDFLAAIEEFSRRERRFGTAE